MDTKKISKLSIFDQEKIEVSNISQVISSTEKEIIAKANEGYVHIFGTELTISKFSPETDGGGFVATGNIEGIKFVSKLTKKSLLGRVFK